jgi:tRNA (guanine37-N1)-methyltransferase
MRFDVLTLFPSMFEEPLASSILGRACEQGLVRVDLHDIRDHTTNKHRRVDDAPYGGGAGMVMMAEPICATIDVVKSDHTVARTILLSPAGRLFNQDYARELSRVEGGSVVLICGRYEGVDERVATQMCDDVLSIGDYVLSGGEFAAMVIIDAVTRLIPGVLGNDNSTREESLENGLLEYPQYTRPRVFRGIEVPSVLVGGHHKEVAAWRHRAALNRTRERRPDLFDAYTGSSNKKKLLDS